MKKFALLIIVFLFTINYISAQSLLERLGKSAKDAAEQAVEKNIDKSIEKGVDKAFDKSSYQKDKAEKAESEETSTENSWTCPACTHEGNTGKFCSECGAKQPAVSDGNWTCPACTHEGNTGKFCSECGAKQPVAEDHNTQNKITSAPEKSLEMTYAKSDFVAGDEIIFEDNVINEQLGEFPSQWDLLHGNVEVAKLSGQNVILGVGNDDPQIIPLFENMKNYLPDQFTIEFDFWIGPWAVEIDNNKPQNNYQLFFYSEDEFECQKISLDGSHYNEEDFHGEILWNYQSPAESSERSGNTNVPYIQNAWNHFSLSFNKRAMKVYVNGMRYINIPNTKIPKHLMLMFYRSGGYYMNNSSIVNFRIAKGAVPLYDRMMSDGKFITYGITFDIGKSTIKPESMGEINRIVKLMNEKTDLKFSVEGHTDNTGNVANNQTLSETRSKAIVNKLVEMGIAADRLTSSGKGQNNPIAENNTEEGRAKNRRVEFVKM